MQPAWLHASISLRSPGAASLSETSLDLFEPNANLLAWQERAVGQCSMLGPSVDDRSRASVGLVHEFAYWVQRRLSFKSF